MLRTTIRECVVLTTGPAAKCGGMTHVIGYRFLPVRSPDSGRAAVAARRSSAPNSLSARGAGGVLLLSWEGELAGGQRIEYRCSTIHGSG